jgi:hypothetical protein
MEIDFILVTELGEHYRNRWGKTMKSDKDRTQSEYIRITSISQSGTIYTLSL